MLVRLSILAAFMAVFAVQIPVIFEKFHNSTEPKKAEIAASSPTPASVPANSVTLKADGQGHYSGTFKLNGKPVDGLIDTGASLVAINESTARTLGYNATTLDFKYDINTANGKTDAAHVTLTKVEIGGIRVENVDAFVLRDKALTTTLIGMSFLKKLGGYQVNGDRMSLRR